MSTPSGCQLHTDHPCSIWQEILCHLPYAIFSVAAALLFLSFLSAIVPVVPSVTSAHSHTHDGPYFILFHVFHFIHILFSTTGTFITFSRFSSRIGLGFLVSAFSGLFFCTISDILVPHLGGMLFGQHMHMHLCLLTEIHNIFPFLVAGLLNGYVMSSRDETVKAFYSVTSHFFHVLISSLASLFYLIAEGFVQWHEMVGMVFILLIVAVLVPCTLADLIVPALCGRLGK